MLKDASDSRASCERANAALQAVIATAETSGTTSTTTLREAVQKLKHDEAKAQVVLITSKLDQTRIKADRAIAEERAKQIAAEKTAELKRLQVAGVVQEEGRGGAARE